MNSSEQFFDILVCPNCLGGLNFLSKEVSCNKCDSIYKIGDSGILDIRLTREKTVNLSVSIGSKPIKNKPKFGVLKTNPKPEVDFDDSKLPVHLTPRMVSYIPKAPSSNSLCLDLGCGAGHYRESVEKAGYKWVGFDYRNPKAPLWADAHALPFMDNTFDFVLSLAVLEHIQYPSVMLREVHRVLKPNGVYLGSVAYLVPFHDQASYYNMTHYGVWSGLEDAGMNTIFVFGEPEYSGIRALSFTGLFPGLKRQIAYALIKPIEWTHHLYWALKRRKSNAHQFSKDWQNLLNTGAFVFQAVKPVDK